MAVVASLASCSEEEKFVEPVPTLELVSSNVTFDAEPSNGEIIVSNSASGSISASSSESWCTVSISGNEAVNVSVPRYDGYEGRTAVITVSNGTDQLHVPVSQSGALWAVVSADSLDFHDLNNEATIRLKSNFDYHISTPDWITFTKEDNNVTFHALPNLTGKPRFDKVTISSKRGDFSFNARQFGVRDIEGTYEATYTAFTEETNEKGDRIIAADGLPVRGEFTKTFKLVRSKTDTLQFNAVGLSKISQVQIPFHYDMNTRRLSVNNVVKLYSDPIRRRYYHTVLLTEAGHNLATETLSYWAPYSLDEESMLPIFKFADQRITVTSGDNKTETDLNGFYVFAFSSTVLSYSNMVGYNDMYQRVTFRRIN